MKKILLTVLATCLAAGSLFAVDPNPGRSDQGPDSRDQRPEFFGIDWKIGTVVTTEYKKLTGQLVLGEKIAPVFKAEGIEYSLLIPRMRENKLDIKNGDTVTFEGLATNVKTADGKVQQTFHPFKATINGQEVDLRPPRMGRGREGVDGRGMMNGPGRF